MIISTVALTALAVILKSVEIYLYQKNEDDHNVSDGDRLSVNVKHNKYADPLLEHPLKRRCI